ncbi:MAG: SPASM domain-containing protein, partial [Candidatus Latescibacterota bacterium]
HSGEGESPAKKALAAAKKLGLPADNICIEEPRIETAGDDRPCKGEPVVGGDVRFRGRAVDKLAMGLPRKPWQSFNACNDEELENPQRVHIDPFGNVHVCQGVSIGNMWEKPLSDIIRNYDAYKHPICGPLLRGGPAELARTYNVEHEDETIDECHLCYQVRRALLKQFPQYLAPRLVYGLEDEEDTDKEA